MAFTWANVDPDLRHNMVTLHNDELIHWGRVTHICVSKLTIIGSYNGLSPDRRHAIMWTNAGLLLIGPLGTNFSEILIEILTISFKKMRLKVSSAKLRPFCLGLNELTHFSLDQDGNIADHKFKNLSLHEYLWIQQEFPLKI